MFMIKHACCGIILTQEVPLQFKQHFIRLLNTKAQLYICLEVSRSTWLSIYLPPTLVPGTRLYGALVQQAVSEYTGHTQTKAGLLT